MKIDQVPQDQGMIDGDRHEVCYAVNKQGRYVLVQSAGWEPKNVVNDQAWELIKEKVESGRYSSASEVVREALRLFEDHEMTRSWTGSKFTTRRLRRSASTAGT